MFITAHRGTGTRSSIATLLVGLLLVKYFREEGGNTQTLHNGGRGGSNLGPDISGLLGDWASDGGTLHLTLWVDNDSGVILEVEENTILSSPGLSLSDDDALHDLLTELGLTLLDSADDHITDTSGGQHVKTTLEALDGNDAQVLGASVVSAVHDGANRQTEGNFELATTSSSLSYSSQHSFHC
jgi:hypothetical protein